MAVTTHVVVGKSMVYCGARLHGESVNLKVVIDTALDAGAGRVERSLIFKRVESYPSEAAIKG